MAGQEHLLEVDAVLPRLNADTRERVFQKISSKVAQDTGLCQKDLFDKLMHSERQSSSGIGNGVAIPHLRCPNLVRPFSLLAQLREKVAFESVDQKPVDLVFLLLSPERDGPYHLRRLSRVTRVLMDHGVLSNIRSLEEGDEIQAALLGTSSLTEKMVVNG